MGHLLEHGKQARISEGAVKQRRDLERGRAAFVEGDRSPVLVHGGGIPEPLEFRVGLVDRACPSLRARSWTAADRHRSTRSPGPCTREVQKRRRGLHLEGHEPWLIQVAIDSPRFLEDLCQAGWAVRRCVENPSFLKPRGREVVIETAPGWSEGSKAVPESRMGTAAKIHPPEPLTRTERQCVGSHETEPGSNRRFGELRQEEPLYRRATGKWRSGPPVPREGLASANPRGSAAVTTRPPPGRQRAWSASCTPSTDATRGQAG